MNRRFQLLMSGALIVLGCRTPRAQPDAQRPAAEAPDLAQAQKTEDVEHGGPDASKRPPELGASAASSAGERPPVRLLVRDPRVLEGLEAAGWDLGSRLHQTPARRASELAEGAAYRELARVLAQDLANDRARDPAAGVGMRFAHRQFDARWLRSSAMAFSLVGVVPRVDRKVFAPEHCGELRLVYRLGYQTETRAGQVASRLPMTINVVYFEPRVAGAGCAEVAESFRPPPSLGPAASDELAWLLSEAGPMSARRQAGRRLKSVEVNLQSVRWPSTVRPALGGHAEYVMRVFRPLAREPFLAPAELENTPDVPRLRRSARERRQLRELLSDPASLARIDQGTLVLPKRFLARRAVSVSPHGLARKANRPFASLFAPEDFAGLDLSGYPTIGSPRALLRRLDALTCVGCHQSRSIAGFHLLGKEAAGDVVDAVHVPLSPHALSELARRAAYVRALGEGLVPAEERPSAELSHGPPELGAHCGLGDPGFASFRCAAGQACVEVGDEEVGQCATAARGAVGDACQPFRMRKNLDPHRDGAKLAARPCRESRVCEATRVGFPGGLCAGGCGGLGEGEVCGGIPLLVQFNGCLAQKVPFERCIAQHTRAGALRACDAARPCRDDYVCAKLGNGHGGCLPPYFLFQLRVDGHPL